MEIRKSARSSILDEIQAEDAGHIRKCAVAVVDVENVALVAAPCVIRTDGFVDGSPALLVVIRGARLVGRFGDDLAPEKTVEVVARPSGDHAIEAVEIGEAVMVEIPRVARPSPPPDADAGGVRCGE